MTTIFSRACPGTQTERSGQITSYKNRTSLQAIDSVSRKKVTAAFDGGRITSDGGVMLLSQADWRIGIVDRIAGMIDDPRDPALITHSVASIVRARVLAIARGYETLTTWTACAAIRGSSWPAVACQTAAATCVPS